MKKLALFGALLFVVALLFLGLHNRPKYAQIAIKGKTGMSSYFVEIADTPEKSERGLMWRKTMPKEEGMLFIFPNPSIIRMWMKNTYIPLDMIFFNAQNQVICLRENTIPLDDKNIISCPYPAQKVLELNAGEIKARKIQLGDVIFIK